MTEYSFKTSYSGQTHSVSVTTPAPREIWKKLMSKDRQALVEQSPEWTNAVCRHAGYRDASRLYEFTNGHQLVLPLVRRDIGPLAAGGSMPEHWGYGGLLAADGITAEDVSVMWVDLLQTGWLRIHIRPNPLQTAVWEQGSLEGVNRSARIAHALPLEKGFGEIWKNRFTGTTRRNIRKADKAGLDVECGMSEKLIDEFYLLFEQSVQRWARQQNEPLRLARWRSRRRDPRDKFGTIAASLNESFQLWVARYKGEPAAAILVLQGRNAHYTRGAMNRRLANETRANDMLHKLAIEAACEAGCETYHMGDTGDAASLARFKEKFGARPVPYASYHWERLPITAVNQTARSLVKRLIGFNEN